MRQLFDQSSASSDRLKRVHAMGKYVDEQRESDRNLDNVVMLGDPLLYKTLVAVIKNIKVAAKKEKVLDGDKLHETNVSLVIQLIDLELHENDMLVWNGQNKGTQVTVPGADCLALHLTEVS